MSDWKRRRDSFMPYQEWNAFPPEAIVLVKNAYGDSRIDQAKNLWWGHEEEFGKVGEGVILLARRLDRPSKAKQVEKGQ